MIYFCFIVQKTKSKMSNSSIFSESAIEEAKWEAEFAENRMDDLLDEYREAKANQDQEHGEDTFPNLSGVGATVWIRRNNADGLVCYFDTIEEGFEFGQTFLREHTSDLRSEMNGTLNYVEWRDKMGALWAANYVPMDSVNIVLGTGKGFIGSSGNVTVGMYKGRKIDEIIWGHMGKACIVPAGLAIKLGLSNMPRPVCLEPLKDRRLNRYVLTWPNTWQMEAVLGRL